MVTSLTSGYQKQCNKKHIPKNGNYLAVFSKINVFYINIYRMIKNVKYILQFSESSVNIKSRYAPSNSIHSSSSHPNLSTKSKKQRYLKRTFFSYEDDNYYKLFAVP